MSINNYSNIRMNGLSNKMNSVNANLNNLKNEVDGDSTTSTEQLVNRLVTKIALNSNIIVTKRDDFINSNIQYLTKLLCSQTYAPIYDYFEIGQKIKKKCNFKLKLAHE